MVLFVSLLDQFVGSLIMLVLMGFQHSDLRQFDLLKFFRKDFDRWG